MGGGFIIKLNPPCTLQNCWGTLLLLSLIDVIGSFALLNSCRPHNYYRRHESSSSSCSIIFFFRDEELGWTDEGMDGWKGRPPKDII
jgi:hypothetical protein